MYNRDRVVLKRRPITVVKETETDNFLGLGKRARKRKDDKHAVKMEGKRAKIASRSYKKQVKADSLGRRYSGKSDAAVIQAQGEAAANIALANQGIVGNPIQQQPDTASQLLGAASGLLGGAGNGDSLGYPEDQRYLTEDQLNDSSIGGRYNDQNNPLKKGNTMMYVIIGVVAVAAFLYFKKK